MRVLVPVACTCGLLANAACSRAPTAAEAALAAAVEPCLQGGAGSVMVSPRVVIGEAGEVLLIQIKGRDGEPGYEAVQAVMRAIQDCEPYRASGPGDFDIVLRY